MDTGDAMRMATIRCLSIYCVYQYILCISVYVRDVSDNTGVTSIRRYKS